MSWGPEDSYETLDGTTTSIKHVTNECNTLTTTTSKVLYPDDVCERARSLYISGLFTLIFFMVTWTLNVYLIYATNKFTRNQKFSSKLEKLNQILVWLYVTSILTYIIFSLSFLYLKEIGWGCLLALAGVAMTLI